MTTTDKAQEKLVNSMRKTKARSGGTPASAKKAPEAKPAVSRPKKKVSSRAAKTSPKKTAAKTARQIDAGSYQACPRVWPD
jgi:hypothetical protein